MKKAAIVCWIIQGMAIFGMIFLNNEPFIPDDVLAIGFPFIILFLIPQFLFLILGCIFFAIYKKNKNNSSCTYNTKNWRKIIDYFVIALLAVFAIFSATYIGYQHGSEKRSAEEEKLQFEVSALNSRNTALRNEVQELQNNLKDANSELDFWQECAVIVTVEGKKYHRYGCYYTDNRSFWIYNVEAAIGKGYEPCLVCNPPTR